MQVSLAPNHQTRDDIALERQWIEASRLNPAAFRPLYNKYYEPVLRFVYRRLGRLEDAGDIAAQTFLNAMQNLAKYEHRGLPFSSWLYRIAINEMNRFFRERNKYRSVCTDDNSLAKLASETGSGDREEELDELENTLLLLSSADFLLIEMRFFEGRSFKEIGEILEITENNAKVKTYRILDRLKKALKTQGK